MGAAGKAATRDSVRDHISAEENVMNKQSTIEIGLVLTLCFLACSCRTCGPHEFTKISSRVMFFEDRINSTDSSVRRRVLVEASYFHHLPDAEYVGFLERMYQDPDSQVRGAAVRKLYGMWVPQDPADLPREFTGYGYDQLVDREAEATVPALLAQCAKGGLGGGYAAYVVGLLRVEEAIPALRELADDDNIFVRYTAARALLNCGDKASAIAIFEDISATQLALYAAAEEEGPGGRGDELSPFYAACACRGLIEAGGQEEFKGLSRLIDLMGFLARSSNANDQSNLHWVRATLAARSGRYFTTPEEASNWLAERQGKTGSPKQAPAGDLQ